MPVKIHSYVAISKKEGIKCFTMTSLLRYDLLIIFLFNNKNSLMNYGYFLISCCLLAF